MKTLFTSLFKLNLIIWILLLSNTIFAQIESSGFGGLWSDGATWIGGNPPGPADDVIINGPVNLNINTSCNNITINGSGLFQNYSSASRTLTISGNITNYGTIQNNVYNLTLEIHGDIINEGTWQNYGTSLIGISNQNITSTTSFDGTNFTSLKATGYTYANSSLRFNNSIVDFNDDSLYMNVGNDSIFIQGSYTQDISIIANSAPWQVYCHLSGGAYFNDVVIESDDAVLDGTVEYLTFFHVIGNARVEGILQTGASNSNTANIFGNMINNGTISDNVYNTYLYITGDITQNGVWNNYHTYLDGDTDQNLLFTHSFEGEYLTNSNIDGKVISNSSLTFYSTIIDFNYDTLRFAAGADSLKFYGQYFQECVIIKDGAKTPGFLNCTMGGNGYFHDMIVIADNIDLSGVFQFSNPMAFYGHVIVNDTMQTRATFSYTAYVFGNLTNNGTISDNVYNTYLYITGDITQNGVWNNYHTYLDGDSDQNLFFTESFDGEYLTNSNTDGKVISNSSLTFYSTIIDFNYDTLRFAAGADSLKFYGQYFQECVIIKDGAKTPGFLNCTMGGNGYFHDMKVVGDNIDLSGVFQFSNPMAFYGHVTVNDTLQTLATSSYTAYIYGNLTNNGAIKDNVYSTYLYITGDITHNGVWNNYHTYLDGDTDQNLFFTQSFDGGYLTNSNTDGKVISNSTLAFNNTYIDFNNDTLVFSSGADSLILTGRYFQEAVIMKEGSKTSGFLNCTMGGNGYFHDMIIVGDNIDLGGTFQFTAPMAFYGHVTVTGFIQVYASSSYTAYVNGDLTNNGAIKNNVYSTSLYISGDISQNGVWENYYTYLNGSSLQNLSQTSPFACFRIVDTDPSSAIQANTDIEFQNTDVDLGGSTLFMVDNGVITIQDSWFIDADIISNNFDLSMSGISYLSDVSADNVTIYDWVQVRNGCTFSGLTKVEGILSCNNTGSYTLDIDGDIINSGSIQNYSYSLSLNIAGNLFNNGTWSNYRTYLNGSNDQIIYLLNNQEISGTVIFDALSAGAPYQWYFEGGILNSTSFTGETSNNLVWSDPVSPAWYGDFYCQTGAGPSRTITVEGGLIVDISVFLEGSFNGINMNTTLNDNGHIPFTQPYNITPWNYVGTESVASIPPDITDWVLLEFRETTGGSETATPGTMIAQRALFLNNDGYIVNLDGTRDIKIEVPTVNSNLYVVVWHRNHLGVMTSNPVSFDSAPYSYDFTSGESQAYGGALGQNELGGGMYGMMGGDANSDSDVDGADFNIWQSNAGGAANYEKADLNMNNQVNNTDKNDILVGNTGQSSQVPE